MYQLIYVESGLVIDTVEDKDRMLLEMRAWDMNYDFGRPVVKVEFVEED